VRPPEHLAEAETVYLLWGEVRQGDPAHAEVLRPEPPRVIGPELWLVVRGERLDWGEGVYRQLLAAAARLARAGQPAGGHPGRFRRRHAAARELCCVPA
jgi:hypothetical protein